MPARWGEVRMTLQQQNGRADTAMTDEQVKPADIDHLSDKVLEHRPAVSGGRPLRKHPWDVRSHERMELDEAAF